VDGSKQRLKDLSSIQRSQQNRKCLWQVQVSVLKLLSELCILRKTFVSSFQRINSAGFGAFHQTLWPIYLQACTLLQQEFSRTKISVIFYNPHDCLLVNKHSVELGQSYFQLTCMSVALLVNKDSNMGYN
jgi:hypothetical protein